MAVETPALSDALTHLGQPHVLREYALLADGERGALVGPRGDVAWMCFPSWDSDPLFASLLGAPSLYSVAPLGRSVWGGYYEEGTLIWHSRWASGGSIVECREALAFPGDPRRCVLLRRVEALNGDAELAAVLDLREDWGRRPVELRPDPEEGAWTGRAGAVRVRWSGAGEARPEGQRALVQRIALRQGQHHDLVLELSCDELDAALPHPDGLWRATEAAWRRQVPELRAVARRDARQAYAVLRGLTTGGGGMVACATTSLPERASEGRDYDYRYAWIRDQCYAGVAVAPAGAPALLDSAVAFCSELVLADGPQLRPLYRVDGGPAPDAAEVDLPGYPGAPSVHCGNRAVRQLQLDAFGEVLVLLATAAEQDRLDAAQRRAAEVAAGAVERRWREPDSGVWELGPREWTHSRLTCATGLRRAVAAGVAQHGAGDRWLDLARAIEADTAARCLHPTGRWQRAPDDDRVDAALLVPAIRGGIPAADPRTVATLDAVRRELGDDGFVYRYPHPGRALHEVEGAFLLCSFWTAIAELQQGRVVDAVRRFDRARTACGPPGLFSEEFDVQQRQLRGNLPQAFVHALMLECAAHLRDVVGEDA